MWLVARHPIPGADLGGPRGLRAPTFVRVPISLRYFSNSGVSTNSELAKFCNFVPRKL